MAGNEHELTYGYVMSKCYNDFPVLHFLFDRKWLAVHPQDYVVDVSEKKDRSLCVLLLSPGTHPFLVMGMPLYMNYYAVHEDSNERIGFAPHTSSPKAGLSKGIQPERVLGSTNPVTKMSALSWYIAWAFIILFATVWLILITEIFNTTGSYA